MRYRINDTHGVTTTLGTPGQRLHSRVTHWQASVPSHNQAKNRRLRPSQEAGNQEMGLWPSKKSLYFAVARCVVTQDLRKMQINRRQRDSELYYVSLGRYDDGMTRVTRTNFDMNNSVHTFRWSHSESLSLSAC